MSPELEFGSPQEPVLPETSFQSQVGRNPISHQSPVLPGDIQVALVPPEPNEPITPNMLNLDPLDKELKIDKNVISTLQDADPGNSTIKQMLKVNPEIHNEPMLPESFASQVGRNTISAPIPSRETPTPPAFVQTLHTKIAPNDIMFSETDFASQVGRNLNSPIAPTPEIRRADVLPEPKGPAILKLAPLEEEFLIDICTLFYRSG
jgi:hypothetical protein